MCSVCGDSTAAGREPPWPETTLSEEAMFIILSVVAPGPLLDCVVKENTRRIILVSAVCVCVRRMYFMRPKFNLGVLA
jgi:hypothetical protein